MNVIIFVVGTLVCDLGPAQPTNMDTIDLLNRENLTYNDI